MFGGRLPRLGDFLRRGAEAWEAVTPLAMASILGAAGFADDKFTIYDGARPTAKVQFSADLAPAGATTVYTLPASASYLAGSTAALTTDRIVYTVGALLATSANLAFDGTNFAHNGAGNFNTGTGNVGINGTVTIASGKNIIFANGILTFQTSGNGPRWGTSDATTNADFEFPAVSTAQVEFRLLRATNTSGNRYFSLYRGNGTSTLAHRLSGDGASCFGDATLNLASGVGANFGNPTANAFTSQRVIGINGTSNSAATGDYSGLFIYGWGTAAAAYTCPTVAAIRVNVATLGAGSAITNLVTLAGVRNTLGANNAFLVYGTSFATTGNWCLYNGTADGNYFGTGWNGFGSNTAIGSERMRIAGGSAATATATDVLIGAGIIDMGASLRYQGTQVVSSRRTGWSTWTGTATRTTQAADDSTTASAGYVQAEVQAINDRLLATRQRLKALIDDLHNTAGHGLIGT